MSEVIDKTQTRIREKSNASGISKTDAAALIELPWQVTQSFDAVVAKALQKDTDLRFFTAAEMKVALDKSIQGVRKFDFFIGHNGASEDQEFAQQLRTQLLQMTWPKENKARAGERVTVCVSGADFCDVAAVHLCRSACFVPIISQRVLDSLGSDHKHSQCPLFLQVQIAIGLIGQAGTDNNTESSLRVVPMLCGNPSMNGTRPLELLGQQNFAQLSKSHTRKLKALQATVSSIHSVVSSPWTSHSPDETMAFLVDHPDSVRTWEVGSNHISEIAMRLLAIPVPSPQLLSEAAQDRTQSPVMSLASSSPRNTDLKAITVESGIKYQVGEEYEFKKPGAGDQVQPSTIFGRVQEIRSPTAEELQQYHNAGTTLPPSAALVSIEVLPPKRESVSWGPEQSPHMTDPQTSKSGSGSASWGPGHKHELIPEDVPPPSSNGTSGVTSTHDDFITVNSMATPTSEHGKQHIGHTNASEGKITRREYAVAADGVQVSVGDHVAIISDHQKLERLQAGLRDFSSWMLAYCGTIGTVVNIDTDGDVRVHFENGVDTTWKSSAIMSTGAAVTSAQELAVMADRARTSKSDSLEELGTADVQSARSPEIALRSLVASSGLPVETVIEHIEAQVARLVEIMGCTPDEARRMLLLAEGNIDLAAAMIMS